MKLLDKLNCSDKLTPLFSKLGIETNWDLLLHLPLRYEDLTKLYPIVDAKAGQTVLLQGSIIGCEVVYKKRKQLIVRIDDGSSILSLIFFHFYPSYATQYKVGKEIRVFGEVGVDYFGNKTMFHPKIQTVKDEKAEGLAKTFTPIYPITNKLTNGDVIKLVDTVLEHCEIEDYLPHSIIKNHEQLSLPQALLTLHKLTPKQYESDYHLKALERLKFDELIAQQLLMHNIYLNKHKNKASIITPTHKYIIELLKKLPFSLTNSQNKVIKEILQDMAKPTQMNRLLQGDVGSGKTIVATICALAAIENGFQAVIMAPTEILAEQHYLKTRDLLSDTDINIVWLSGSLTAKQKAASIELCQTTGQIIIGTHAVFQDKVEFNNLGLIIIDEQHKFGVEQRLLLVNKGVKDGEVYPHQLMMSATPIPRSLALSYYADLDVSTINELPPNRSPIQTLLIKNSRRKEIINFVKEHASLGHQIYWVCPLIEESEKLELENAKKVYEELSEMLSPIKVGLVHGKMKAKEKAEVMADFQANWTQVLVATTVIEVGVDVPNACIMVIEHSERMGLAQLHQLRGRVGRGSIASQCVLLYDEYALGEISKKRLKAITGSTDGFEIARQDLLIRGPGELLGQRQSGLPSLKFANLEEDLDMLHTAKNVAAELIENHHKSADEIIKLWFHEKQYLGA
ncbi:MAG: ATP-dependent DNA helicase RecG [Neisseriaceae bacterium]|nr:MAG: ATP-dependent DNA helicase RecG [Neisseriaceae bacterium]